MNATAATRNIWTEGTSNIIRASVNVAVPHTFPSSSLRLAPKIEPERAALDLLPQYLQDNISSHMATMLNLFDDVKKKEVGLSKFNKTENGKDLNIPTFLKIMKNPLNTSKDVKGTEKY